MAVLADRSRGCAGALRRLALNVVRRQHQRTVQRARFTLASAAEHDLQHAAPFPATNSIV